jgi:DNA-binding NarL/FixJ family response regulator
MRADAEPRHSFVVHVDGPRGPLLLRDLDSLRRARLDSIERLPAQLAEWLRPAPAAGELRRPEVRRRVRKLTRSQARTARLVADGLSNKQVADTLGVQLRTVESHLTATYQKLGVRSRRALTQLLDEVRP